MNVGYNESSKKFVFPSFSFYFSSDDKFVFADLGEAATWVEEEDSAR